eukprot:TRINITY_DN7270_c0_g1_i1.p1 TRINITY_DN7270_c0_g1~~TRINITY_DN7270_c0_g1_i1.p1  ORF type:complete len:901 (-),score=109.22 TRINITY_DN7270_c0_g1_i1:483-3185(-)
MLILGFLILLLLDNRVRSFKEHDFKKCKDAGFCERKRGHAGDMYTLMKDTLSVQGGTLQIKLENEDHEDNPTFDLTLTLIDGGLVRLQVDEVGNKGRFRVPEVLVEDGIQSSADWEQVQKGDEAVIVKYGDVQVKLQYWPFLVEVRKAGEQTVVLNSRQMFSYEHLRQKKDSDPASWWEESFKSHKDSKPKGPEAISFDASFPGNSRVYGLPERATKLALKPTVGVNITSEPYRMYNLDVFEYLHESPFGLYGSIPLLLAHKVGYTCGLFWLNAAEMYVDVLYAENEIQTQWIAESGIIDLFIMLGPTPQDVLKQYGRVTGTTAMPQMFAIGYHQCRWNYRDEKDALQVDSGFDQHVIPYDVLWLDIEHTDGKKYMTWDSKAFPNPRNLLQDVSSRGRKMVTIVDPHMKRDKDYALHQEAEKNGYYVKNKEGKDFEGWCWPGSSSYLDVLNPQIREWWAQQFSLQKYAGSTCDLYIWNDMNEPSVFNGPEVTMHKDNLHFNNVEHRDIHNLYGYLYHLATAQGLELRGRMEFGEDGDRPFVLSRAFFAGTQRVGPIWTGDNTADWNHIKVSVPMLLTLGLTGLPFSGADVGGFFGNPDAELLTRWYQLGAYYPFFRGHAHLETKRREPWLFGEETTNRIRNAIYQRYTILPYLYTQFRWANLTGEPIMRAMWYEFPSNPDLFDVDDQFLIGPGFLVKPVLEHGVGTVNVHLPKEEQWYNAINGELLQPHDYLESHKHVFHVAVNMDYIPTFYRGGNIIPRRERQRRSTQAMQSDPFTLVVALDAQQKAIGDLYLDDGRSFAFLKGSYVHRQFIFENNKLINRAHPDFYGVQQSRLVIERIVILGIKNGPQGWRVMSNNKELNAAPGKIGLDPQTPQVALVIRKPELQIGQDWELNFIQGN